MKKLSKLVIFICLGLFASLPVAAEERDGKRKGGYFKKMDTDDNGSISRAEFVAHHTKRFEQIDSNSDGSLSKDEMKAHHKKRKQERQERQNRKK